MDVLPFILEAEGEAGVGGLGLFYCTLEEGFNSRRPDREFIVDPHLFGFGTPDEFSEVVVSPCHLDPDVELLECLTGRRFICFLTDVPRFCWAWKVSVLRPMLNQVLEAGGIVFCGSAGGRIVSKPWVECSGNVSPPFLRQREHSNRVARLSEEVALDCAFFGVDDVGQFSRVIP